MLIADDDPFNLIALEGLLGQLNVRTSKVYDGQAAIEAINRDLNKSCQQHDTFKLVILDCEMPQLTGIEVA